MGSNPALFLPHSESNDGFGKLCLKHFYNYVYEVILDCLFRIKGWNLSMGTLQTILDFGGVINQSPTYGSHRLVDGECSTTQ